MKKKSKLSVLAFTVAAVLALTLCVVSLTACGERPATAIKIVTQPTVTSKYNEDLKIADDGVLMVKYEDNSREEVAITLAMIDTKKFDKTSMEEQTLVLNYGGKSASFKITLVREVSSVSIKKAPTVTSIYTNTDFKIAADGELNVTFADGGTATVAITQEMIDTASIDPASTAKQNVKVNYGGQTATFEVALIYEDEDNEGTERAFRFQAENAELGGEAGTEDATGQTDENGAQVTCVKDLFHHAAGGTITWKINSDKRTSATMKIRISVQYNAVTINELDRIAKLTLNGEEIPMEITMPEQGEDGGDSWWVWTVQPVKTTLHLRRGENTLVFATNECSGREERDVNGGRNVDYIEITTTGDLS